MSWSVGGSTTRGAGSRTPFDLIGERWALLVVRELLLGPKRFSRPRACVPGASPDVLANRLRELQEAGVVGQRKLPPPAGSQVYELTDWGAELEPVVTLLGRWGSRSPSLPHDAHSSIDSLLLSLRSLFDPQAALGLNATITLRVEGRPFHVEITDNELRLAAGEAHQPAATLETDRHALAALLHGGRRLDDALHAGEATVTGSTAVVARFLELFPLPEPAGTLEPSPRAGPSIPPAPPTSVCEVPECQRSRTYHRPSAAPTASPDATRCTAASISMASHRSGPARRPHPRRRPETLRRPADCNIESKATRLREGEAIGGSEHGVGVRHRRAGVERGELHVVADDHDAVTDRRDRQRTLLDRPGLRDEHPPRRQRPPPPVPQVLGQLAEEPVHAVLLDISQGDLVDTRRAVVAAHRDPRPPQDVSAIDLVPQRVKPSSRIGLGRPVKRMLQGTNRIHSRIPLRWN